MQFTNITEDERQFPAWGVSVEAGATFDTPVELAEQIALQCGDDGAFRPADDEATELVEQAFRSADAATDGLPNDSEPKYVWVAFAEANRLDVDQALKAPDYKAAVKAAYLAAFPQTEES